MLFPPGGRESLCLGYPTRPHNQLSHFRREMFSHQATSNKLSSFKKKLFGNILREHLMYTREVYSPSTYYLPVREITLNY